MSTSVFLYTNKAYWQNYEKYSTVSVKHITMHTFNVIKYVTLQQ